MAVVCGMQAISVAFVAVPLLSLSGLNLVYAVQPVALFPNGIAALFAAIAFSSILGVVPGVRLVPVVVFSGIGARDEFGNRATSLRTGSMLSKKKRQVKPSGTRHASAPLSAPPAELSVTMLKVLKQFRMVIKSIRHHYQEVERRTGVSGAQIWVLAHVADHPKTKVGELATALAVHPSTASNLVRKLDASGMLTRRRIPDDQRAVQLQLTQSGELALQHAPKPLIGVLQQALKDLPPRRLHELHDALGHLVSNIELKDPSAQSVLLSEIK